VQAAHPSPPEPVQALLFDLGRVVIDIDFGRVLAAWARSSGLATPPAAVAHDSAYQQHEVGTLSAEDYFRHLRGTLGLDCDDAAMRDGWNQVFLAPIEETVAMIRAVRGRIPCHAFSNTNATHLAQMRRAYPEVLDLFGTVFASHEIARRKPDPQAFAHLAQALGIAPRQVLFFDDLQDNVAGARACGMQAVWVRSPADVRAALIAQGLLAD
jgi:glucose-1-phosphatase